MAVLRRRGDLPRAGVPRPIAGELARSGMTLQPAPVGIRDGAAAFELESRIRKAAGNLLHRDEFSAGLAEAGFDDLRPAHTAVFQHIDTNGTRLTDLAERAQITKQSMSYLVDYLEQRGYLERRPDPSDRRASLIRLTDRGWDQVQAALAIIADLEKEWTRTLGKQQMQELRASLTELAQTTSP